MGYRVRPYEVQPGAAQAAVEGSKRLLYEALYKRTNIFLALFRCRKLFEAVKVDRLRPRAKVAIIGEFWAMTTEGDGNYHLQKFLESEGAENDIQLTTAWLLYNIWEVARDTRERKHLQAADGGPAGLQGYDEFGITKRLAAMRVAEPGAARALRVLRAAHRPEALPPRRHGRDRRDRPALLLQRPARRRGPHGGRQADLQRDPLSRRT
jgi:hypothetical protein